MSKIPSQIFRRNVFQHDSKDLLLETNFGIVLYDEKWFWSRNNNLCISCIKISSSTLNYIKAISRAIITKNEQISMSLQRTSEFYTAFEITVFIDVDS